MWKKLLCITICIGFGHFPVLAADVWLEYYQQAQYHARNEEWDEAIDLLEKALASNPKPETLKDRGWTKWGYYPYLELGRAYLAKDDSIFAAYYCAFSKSQGFAPDFEVERCLAQVGNVRKLMRASPETFPAFPWPPPNASTDKVIPSEYLRAPGRQTSLNDIAKRLAGTLESAGYDEKSYYYVPGGFVLVTRIEQINPDGTPKKPPKRWAIDMSPPPIFSLKSYLHALFTAQEGRFRIIAFVVTSELFGQGKVGIRREEAIAWLRRGTKILPVEIGELPYSDVHYCTALIYEFEQKTRDHEPIFTNPSELPAQKHLEKALLWKALVALP